MQTERVISDTRTVWSLNPRHTRVEFAVKNLVFFTVRGRFKDVSGKLWLDGGDIGRSAVEVVIKAAGIDTGSKRRDEHLRAPDFLAAESYPEIRFQSTTVEPGSDRHTLRIKGLLTVRNTQHEVVLEVNEIDQSRSPDGEEVVYYTATTEFDPFAFGIAHRPGLIGRKLKVAINVEASRWSQSDAAVVA
jgi:polyisoprenoid-binding protein YceI